MWTAKEVRQLVELHKEGLDDKQIAREMGKTYDQVKNKRARLNLPNNNALRRAGVTLTRVVSETPERIVYRPPEMDEEPFEDLLERAIRKTQRDVAKAKAQRFCLARVITNKPIAIVFPSDQHLTMSGATDVARAFEDARLIQQTPGVFAVLGGDGVDNHIKHRAAMVKKGSPPTDEYRLYDGYLQTLGLKVLAMVGGNHDAEWARMFTGMDAYGMLAARHKIHYALGEVMIHVELTDDPEHEGQTYKIKLRHRYRFNSQINLIHAVHRMYDLDGDAFDIGVVCHNHEAARGTFNRHGLVRYAIRPGSYQIQTDHGVAEGYEESYPTCPGVILWPGERRIEDFDDLLNVIERLEDARRRG